MRITFGSNDDVRVLPKLTVQDITWTCCINLFILSRHSRRSTKLDNVEFFFNSTKNLLFNQKVFFQTQSTLLCPWYYHNQPHSNSPIRNRDVTNAEVNVNVSIRHYYYYYLHCILVVVVLRWRTILRPSSPSSSSLPPPPPPPSSDSPQAIAATVHLPLKGLVFEATKKNWTIQVLVANSFRIVFAFFAPVGG